MPPRAFGRESFPTPKIQTGQVTDSVNDRRLGRGGLAVGRPHPMTDTSPHRPRVERGYSLRAV
jgi:hypothetical protein